jgi:hypothetical protein
MRRGLRGVGALLVLVFACALVLVPTLALAEDETVNTRVRFFQVYDVDMSGLENTFTYLIEPQESDAPLPIDDEGNAMQQFSMRRDQELYLEFPVPVSVSESADELRYHYILRPERSDLPDGLYFVDAQSTSLTAGINVYYLEIVVRLSSVDAKAAFVVPLIHIEGFDGGKVTDPRGRISYKANEKNEEKEEKAKKDDKTDDSRAIDSGSDDVISHLLNYLLGINGEGLFDDYFGRYRNGVSYSGDWSTSSGSSATADGSRAKDGQGGSAAGNNAGASGGINTGASGGINTGANGGGNAGDNVGAGGSSGTGSSTNATGSGSDQSGVAAGSTADARTNAATGTATSSSGVGSSKEDLAVTADVQDATSILILMGIAVALIMSSFIVRYQRGR